MNNLLVYILDTQKKSEFATKAVTKAVKLLSTTVMAWAVVTVINDAKLKKQAKQIERLKKDIQELKHEGE